MSLGQSLQPNYLSQYIFDELKILELITVFSIAKVFIILKETEGSLDAQTLGLFLN